MTEHPGDTITAATLIADLRRLGGAACPWCGGAVSPADGLMSFAMGFRQRPFCLHCLAGALGREPTALRQWLLDYFRRRDCFRDAWVWVCSGGGDATSPPPENPLV